MAILLHQHPKTFITSMALSPFLQFLFQLWVNNTVKKLSAAYLFSEAPAMPPRILVGMPDYYSFILGQERSKIKAQKNQNFEKIKMVMKSLNANTHLFQVSYLVRMFSSAYEQQTTYHSQALCSRCVIHGTHSSWGSPRFISTWHSEIIFLWCLVAPFTVGSARGLDSYILHPWLVT